MLEESVLTNVGIFAMEGASRMERLVMEASTNFLVILISLQLGVARSVETPAPLFEFST